ncbi:SCO family protein [Novosphingobium taihuense]|uniref:SCO family protein n=1 Tax=Novosphingobium taihuense TaxID=260085 RepID=UPI0013153858|nr:SCO family protein [Novosphingobium taihuense]
MRRALPFLVLLVLVIAAGFVVFCHGNDKQVAETSVDTKGNYQLVATDGTLFTRSSLKGRPYITYFGYAACPDRCPTMLLRLADLRRQMRLAPQQLPIVFITVDPKHDTHERLAAFVKSLGQSIIALTGSAEVVNRVTDNAGVFVERRAQPDGTYRIEHTTNAYLYNADGDFWDTIAPSDSNAVLLKKLRGVLAIPSGAASASASDPPA